MNTIQMALCAYSLPHVMGYIPTLSNELHPTPLSPLGLMDAAVELGLGAVELPLDSVVPSFDGREAHVQSSAIDIIRELKSRNLSIVADYGAVLDKNADDLISYLHKASSAGAIVVRVTLSHLLCGDRRNLSGGWEPYLNALADRLNQVLPAAESLGICVAVENHQDASSDDLLRLWDLTHNSPAFGVTLDTGNPLAVGEDPVEFTKRIAHIVRHIHMKDYTLHYAPNGYRLVRCAAGDGVIDFPEILETVRGNGHDVLPALEVAAQSTRTIPILEKDWWDHYPDGHFQNLIPVLQLLWEKGLSAEFPYSSAWERGKDSAAVAQEEWEIVRKSAAYFHTII